MCLEIYLVTYLEHCLHCLFAEHDFTCNLERNDVEEQVKQLVIVLHLLTVKYASVKSCLRSCPHLVL